MHQLQRWQKKAMVQQRRGLFLERPDRRRWRPHWVQRRQQQDPGLGWRAVRGRCRGETYYGQVSWFGVENGGGVQCNNQLYTKVNKHGRYGRQRRPSGPKIGKYILWTLMKPLCKNQPDPISGSGIITMFMWITITVLLSAGSRVE